MQVEPTPGRPRGATGKSARPLSLADQPFDLPGPVPLRKSYIIASTPRCGSTFLSTRLWATGVLGAPADYFGHHKPIGAKMMERLDASSPADYLGRLLACRTSKNGIFGINAEFGDFEEALRRFPEMLGTLSPVTYIYIERADQMVQAAFMAKSVKIDGLPAGQRKQKAALRYDRDLISKWLGRIDRQRLGWQRWFEANGIVPFVVDYESLIEKPAAVVSGIVELLGAQSDQPQTVRVALAEKPSDRTSEEWAARFEREIQSGIELRDVGTAKTAKPQPTRTNDERGPPHILDRYNAISGTALRPPAAKRLRDRYEVIVARNRALFKDSRVLDLRSGDGRWSFAAIEAGAAEVVGVDSKTEAVEAARNTFIKIGVKPAAYRFVNSKLFAALKDFRPETFDVVLCRDVSADPHFFFKSLARLRPKHIILDTRIADRKEPIVIFRANKPDQPGSKAGLQSASLIAIPNEALIRALCGHFGFRCRAVDPRNVSDETDTGATGDRRRTYILDRVAPPLGRPS